MSAGRPRTRNGCRRAGRWGPGAVYPCARVQTDDADGRGPGTGSPGALAFRGIPRCRYRVDAARPVRHVCAARCGVRCCREPVAAVLDGLALPPVTAVGHSSGGYVATALAEQRPDLVGSLALISSGPSPDALLPQPVVLRALMAPPLGPLLRPIRSDTMLRKGMSAVCNRPVEIPDDLVAEVWGIDYRTFRTVLRRNTAYIAERSVPERLAALDVPVLVIFGAADHRWDPSSVHHYDTVATPRVEQLPDVGHLPMFEAPETTGESLLAFAVAGR
ncbi:MULTISPECIES: alpha/beta fold hydrolase [Streptomyces]|uniref:alpha/beta fold hydrolase n=1 Tax=Streptomyces TaxID=1883 RepID=UPI00362B545F